MCYKFRTYYGVSRHYLTNQDPRRQRLLLLRRGFGGCFENCDYLCSNVGDVRDALRRQRHEDAQDGRDDAT